MDRPLPASKPIAYLSPSGFEILRACRLRASFGQHGQGGRPPRTPQQVLGDLCHAVLEELVTTGAIRRDDWDHAIDPVWLTIAARMAGALEAEPHEDFVSHAPEHWPGYAIKRARLRKAAKRLHDLIASARHDAELICEASLRTSDGRLRGRPDLIVRAVDESWVVDFKSGEVMAGDGRTPREAYTRQLHLYALLEEAASGRWPSRAFLVPLNGPLVEVPIARPQAIALGEEADEALDRFNSVAPGTQPAHPSPETCGYCPWTTRCPTFWESAGAWEVDSLAAAAGVVTSAVHAKFGGVTVGLDVETGSVPAGPIAVLNVSPKEHPAAAEMRPGDEMAAVGLRRLRQDDEFALPAWGQLATWRAAP